MYGNWMIVTFGGVIFAVLLLLALLITPWGAIFAVAFAAVAGIAFAIGMSLRRQRSRGEEDQEEEAERSRPRPVAGRPANPRSGGEPVSGEG
jgi:multisubunit Na+/H+ antiporter MnhB subunit